MAQYENASKLPGVCGGRQLGQQEFIGLLMFGVLAGVAVYLIGAFML
jgi:hypothetical protein